MVEASARGQHLGDDREAVKRTFSELLHRIRERRHRLSPEEKAAVHKCQSEAEERGLGAALGVGSLLHSLLPRPPLRAWGGAQTLARGISIGCLAGGAGYVAAGTGARPCLQRILALENSLVAAEAAALLRANAPHRRAHAPQRRATASALSYARATSSRLARVSRSPLLKGVQVREDAPRLVDVQPLPPPSSAPSLLRRMHGGQLPAAAPPGAASDDDVFADLGLFAEPGPGAPQEARGPARPGPLGDVASTQARGLGAARRAGRADCAWQPRAATKGRRV